MLTALLFATLPLRPALAPQDPLAAAFLNPPASAKPHTWWHWMNGNVTKEGIKADLEAMKAVGIGGAQMFTVDQGIPHGPAGYGGPEWRELTTYAIQQAGRLGIELCIHNCAGWSSSGGPWIKPEDAMQVIAWSDVNVTGPRHVDQVLPQPKAPHVMAAVPYYKDIAVYAYRTPTEGNVSFDRKFSDNFLGQTGVIRMDGLKPDLSPTAAGFEVPTSGLLNLTDKLDASGRLVWDAPEGEWTILRMGHVPTGKDNHPAPPEGDGLEVDKLSKEALDKHWDGLMAKVIADAGPLAGKVLNNSLIDSYEVGSQNWTPKFRQEFRKRRGYDPMPYLPVVAGVTMDSQEKSQRFLWDFRRTIADLFADNYYAHFGDLCHKAGMLFSTEPYGNGGFDTIQSGSKADIPMGEFWIGGGAMETVKVASSVAHVYGRKIVGAESFTADEGSGKWLEEPYTAKTTGDRAFCDGVNRYIFHRYAMQPWLNLKPGMTMGPWGSHFDRTQTWWTEMGSWLKYVTRSQYLLQSGKFVGDICYFYGQDAPVDLPARGNLKPALPQGYDYDGCDTGGLLSMKVKDGRVVLPSGMSYSLLVLPESKFMTPEVAKKVAELVSAGATVYGGKPSQSPSLVGYPKCDDQVRSVADTVWGKSPAKPATQSYFGKGKVVWDRPLEGVLGDMKVKPDFEFSPHNYSTKLIYIHRKIDGRDVYFVSNQAYRSTTAQCTFRVSGKQPELWNPETGKTQDAVAFSESGGRTSLSLNLGPAESVFVVFGKPAPKRHLTSFTMADSGVSKASMPKVTIDKAFYGAADGRGADVTAKVREIVAGQEYEIPASNGLFGDPVNLVVKRLTVEYHLNGKAMKQVVDENNVATLLKSTDANAAPAYDARLLPNGQVEILPWQTYLGIPTVFQFNGTNGYGSKMTLSPSGFWDLSRNWSLTFPPKLGAPATAKFDKLISWSNSPVNGIKYFSGSAVYRKTIKVPASIIGANKALRLDLGEVKNFATVTLNGKTIATLWKPPFVLDVTKFVHAGANDLQIKVTNLWPNRIIGDEQLQPDVEWNGTQLKKWPAWLVNHQPRPKTGRITFETWHYFNKNSPLLDSGLIGPVKLQSTDRVLVKY